MLQAPSLSGPAELSSSRLEELLGSSTELGLNEERGLALCLATPEEAEEGHIPDMRSSLAR